MWTGTLALLHRALRLDARLVRTHLFRLSFAGLIYMALVFAQLMSLSLGAPGLHLFRTMTYLNLGLITLAGISFFSTAITEEKEEDTLGLLKLAGLNPLSILLGKSTSRLLGAMLLLLVQFPFTLLAITLGGVTLGQVLAAYWALLAYMILLSSVGLFCSVSCRRAGTASGVTFLLILVYFLVPALIEGIRFGLVNGSVIPSDGTVSRFFEGWVEWCQAASVYTRVDAIMKTGFADPAIGFQVVSNIVVACGLFLVTWAGFNYFTRDPRSARAGGVRGNLSARLAARFRSRSRPHDQALVWKEYQLIAGGTALQIVKFVVYGLLSAAIVGIYTTFYGATISGSSAIVVMTMLVILVLESALYASRIFHDEWRDRTLPLLMMLPVATPRIVYSKILGCLPALIPALAWLIAGCAVWDRGPEMVIKSLVLPSHIFYVLVYLLFLTLTAFFSLVVRLGALPLALGVMLGASSFGGCCFSPIFMILGGLTGGAGGDQGAFLAVDAVIGTLIAGLQFDIHRRLEMVASH